MNIVILGSDGMLGSELKKIFKNSIALSKKELDISDKKKVLKYFTENKVDVLINAAAFTNVDACENEKQELCFEVNSLGVYNLALASKKFNFLLIQYSTNYVFNGLSKSGYKENSKKNPINIYGYSKYIAENYIEAICNRYYIIRLSNLFGHERKNIVDKFIEIAKEKGEINIVKEQFFSPTYAVDLAVCTKK
ncbi:MAG: NAD(P)-dependent oxidoreductase [Nanoarchaeota archaeon]|nr:NAD(P)-dependent oxidoreductase [Nanoarchaeota archaeon]